MLPDVGTMMRLGILAPREEPLAEIGLWLERGRLLGVLRSTAYGHLDRSKTVPRRPKKTAATKP